MNRKKGWVNAEEAAATIFSKVYCPIEQNCRRYAMALFCCFVGGGVMFLFFTAIGLVPLMLMWYVQEFYGGIICVCISFYNLYREDDCLLIFPNNLLR